MTLGELLGPLAGPHAGTPIADLALDSRQVHPGTAFVAVQGGRAHGLEHAAAAFANGAAIMLYEPPEGPASAARGAAELARLPGALAARSIAMPGLKGRLGALAQRFYGPAIGTPALCGVTGTNGKTTVAYLVAQAMTARGAECGYLGTLGYGVPPDVAAHALTTPDCFTLHRELAAMGARHVAMEVSSHALAQDRVAGLRFRTAAFTNLTRDHLDEHGDLEAYGEAKARLFSREGLRCAVLNMSDPFARVLAQRLPPGAEPLRVGIVGWDDRAAAPAGALGRTREARRAPARDVDVGAVVRPAGLHGLELELSGRHGEGRLASRLVGDFNAENLLVALGVLLAWRVPLPDACRALAGCSAPPGRLEVLADADGRHVVVDYAHTPDALERVLDVLTPLAAGEVWCVFGCGGDRDRGKRPLMGAIAARADHIVLTDDNPRGEDPETIVGDILRGVGAHPSVAIEHDRGAAILRAVRAARPGDVVLIAGKGHETTQRKGTVERAFSDRAVALRALGIDAPRVGPEDVLRSGDEW